MMWKKLQQAYGPRDRTVGKPTLIETTYDGQDLQKMPTVDEVRQNKGLGHEAFGGPGEAKRAPPAELPTLPFENSYNPSQKLRPVSGVPTASSVYTTPSPKFTDGFQHSEAQVLPLFAEKSKIAPPSRLPVPSRKSVGAPGKASSFLPPNGSSSSDMDRRMLHPFDAQQRFAPPSGLGLDTNSHTPWTGASGRAAVMTPVSDHTAGMSSATSDSSDVSPVEGEPYFAAQTYEFGRKLSTISSVSEQKSHDTSIETVYRMDYGYPAAGGPPSVISSNLWDDAISEVYETTPSRRPQPHREHPLARSATIASENDVVPVSRFSWSTRPAESEVPRTPTTRTSHEAPSIMQTPPRDISQPVVSRFSWTTTATETTGSNAFTSPRYAPHSPKTGYTNSPPPARPMSSVMSRKRPVPRADAPEKEPETPNAGLTSPHRVGPDSPLTPVSLTGRGSVMLVKRKPTPSQLLSGTPSTPRTPGGSLDVSKSKDLPLTPTALASVDIITALQAELDDLALRRRNLEKLIASIERSTTAPGRPQNNPMVKGLAQRREEKAKLDDLQKQVDEVRQEEHEVGLRLHRAWKRREQEAPSGLWVRRVTR